MAGRHEHALSPVLHPASVFRHALVAVDGSEAGLEACRQAAVLVEPGGPIDLVYVVDPRPTVYTGLSAPGVIADLEREGEQALAAAAEIAGSRATSRVIRGAPTTILLAALEQTDASFVAVGTHEHRRVTEMILGGVGGELLHRAPCSVLVARVPSAETQFPDRLVVGIDGSPDADGALAVSQHLATRFAVELRIVTAVHESDVDLARVHLRTPFAEEISARPVDALEQVSTEAGLLVVGSRGLHGVRALGSVSERIAHRAACPVLVVRAGRH